MSEMNQEFDYTKTYHEMSATNYDGYTGMPSGSLDYPCVSTNLSTVEQFPVGMSHCLNADIPEVILDFN